MPSTVVFLHAHPDDEALLTGGTIARLAAEGHRVVLVTATDGGAGLAAPSTITSRTLAAVRRDELQRSVEVLGVSELVSLGYADSGLDGSGASSIQGVGSSATTPFARVDVDDAAARVAGVVVAERADLLIGYDAAGGYGHPDHVQVHRVARRAAQFCGGVALLEATMPREPLARAVAVAHRLRRVVPALGGLDPAAWARANSRRDAITHRVDVRQFADTKRTAMAAHASQVAGDGDVRTIQLLLTLPRPVFRGLLGWEWFAGTRSTRSRYYAHPLAALRGR